MGAAVPAMADWCVVDVLNGTLSERVCVAHANPLRAGLVTRIGDYPHWDAIWL